MGDRTYLSIEIRGRIETVDALLEICEALDEDGLRGCAETSLETFAEWLANGGDPFFDDHECNYAAIDMTENTLVKHKIDYLVQHDSGGDYSAGTWAYFSAENREYRNDEGQEVLSLGDIEKALNSDDPLNEVIVVVSEAQKAKGIGQPDFSVSKEVEEFILREVGVIEADRSATANLQRWQQQVAKGNTQQSFQEWLKEDQASC